jgi:hypothetical protein
MNDHSPRTIFLMNTFKVSNVQSTNNTYVNKMGYQLVAYFDCVIRNIVNVKGAQLLKNVATSGYVITFARNKGVICPDGYREPAQSVELVHPDMAASLRDEVLSALKAA